MDWRFIAYLYEVQNSPFTRFHWSKLSFHTIFISLNITNSRSYINVLHYHVVLLLINWVLLANSSQTFLPNPVGPEQFGWRPSPKLTPMSLTPGKMPWKPMIGVPVLIFGRLIHGGPKKEDYREFSCWLLPLLLLLCSSIYWSIHIS